MRTELIMSLDDIINLLKEIYPNSKIIKEMEPSGISDNWDEPVYEIVGFRIIKESKEDKK